MSDRTTLKALLVALDAPTGPPLIEWARRFRLRADTAEALLADLLDELWTWRRRVYEAEARVKELEREVEREKVRVEWWREQGEAVTRGRSVE